MAEPIQATYDELASISNSLTELSNRVDQVYQNLRTNKDSLEGEWEGYGWNAFNSEMEDHLLPGTQKLSHALQNTSTLIQTVSDQFLESESVSAAQIQSLNNNAVVQTPGGNIAPPANGAPGPNGPNSSAPGGGHPTTGASGVPDNSESEDIGADTNWSRDENNSRELFDRSAEREGLNGPWVDTSDQPDEPEDRTQGRITFGEIDGDGGEVSVWDPFVDESWGSGTNQGSFTLEGPGASYDWSAGAGININEGELYAGADFNAEAHLVEVEVQQQFGFNEDYNANFAASAHVGAELDAGAEIQVNPWEGDLQLDVGIDAHVGAKGEISGQVNAGPASVTATAEGGYGLGLNLGGDVGFDDWTFGMEFDAAGYLGLGGGFGVDYEIDAREVAGAVGDFLSPSWVPWGGND